jgi:large subunit ribosomal protein L4
MKVSVYDINKKEVGNINLPKEIFEVELKMELLHQVVVAQEANRRVAIAHTKTRGDVSGGGKKPWRQKGTGRARVGSSRNPIWRHGGITFGPSNERNFSKKLNDKMRVKALFMVLSQKIKDNELFIVDSLKDGDKSLKTKDMNKAVNAFREANERVFIATPDYDKATVRAIRNLDRVTVEEARNLNAFDLLSSKQLLLPKEAIAVIEETFLNKGPKKVEKKEVKETKDIKDKE